MNRRRFVLRDSFRIESSADTDLRRRRVGGTREDMRTVVPAEGGAYWESKALRILEREFRAYCAERGTVATPASVECFAQRCTANGTRNCLGFTRAEIVQRLAVSTQPSNDDSLRLELAD
jgi:hypothetical protein